MKMSSLIVNKYTICLYVQGLGQYDTFFEPTINLITSACPQKHAGFYLSVNMQDFDSVSGHFSDPNDEDVFDQTTELLVNTALANPNKTIHARIYINIDPYGQRYDIIENQKTKLVYLIDRIKSLSNSVRIVLIGHSQGGLVNLEAAIARPYQIERLISLSTPYAPVYVAKLFEQINEIRVIFNGVFEILNGGPYDLSPYSSICVSTLASETYFNDLKGRWNALPYGPTY